MAALTCFIRFPTHSLITIFAESYKLAYFCMTSIEIFSDRKKPSTFRAWLPPYPIN